MPMTTTDRRCSSTRRSWPSTAPTSAIVGIKDYKSEMLCQPWTYGKLALHIPNNADYTVTPENGKMITVQGCTGISNADPQIAQYRKVATAAGVNYAP